MHINQHVDNERYSEIVMAKQTVRHQPSNDYKNKVLCIGWLALAFICTSLRLPEAIMVAGLLLTIQQVLHLAGQGSTAVENRST